jgi:hypothetical protein
MGDMSGGLTVLVVCGLLALAVVFGMWIREKSRPDYLDEDDWWRGPL